jgi:hypothetical protein
MTTQETPVSLVSALKTKAAAARLSVTPKTIRSLVARGLLRPNRATRHLLFPVTELDRFLNESSAAEPAEPANAKSASQGDSLGSL